MGAKGQLYILKKLSSMNQLYILKKLSSMNQLYILKKLKFCFFLRFYLNMIQVNPTRLTPFYVEKDALCVCDLVGVSRCYTHDGYEARVRFTKIAKGLVRLTVTWGEKSSQTFCFKQ